MSLSLLYLFLSQIAFDIAFIGYGYILFRFSKVNIWPSSSLFIYGVAGMFVGIIFTGVLNFFFPLHDFISFIFILLGVVIFFIYRQTILSSLRRTDVYLIATLFLYVFIRSTFGVWVDDSGMYHLQGIKWAKEEIVPFGVANLFGNYGFAISWFPLAALMSLDFLGVNGAFVINASIYFFWGTGIILALSRFKSMQPDSLILLASIVAFFFGSVLQVASPALDLPTLSIAVAVIIFWYYVNYDRTIGSSLLFFVFLCILPTIKLTLLFLALVASFWLLYTAKKEGYLRKFILFGILIFGAILLPWFLKNFMLTGCLLYPLNFLCFDVPWRVTPEIHISTLNGIINYGLSMAGQISNWQEMPTSEYIMKYIEVMLFEPKIYSFELWPAIIFLSIGAYLAAKDSIIDKFSLFVVIALFICLIATWLGSYQTRFAQMYLYLIGIIFLSKVAKRYIETYKDEVVFKSAIILTFFGFVISGIFIYFYMEARKKDWYHIPNPVLKTKAYSGYEVNVPSSIDSSYQLYCFYGKLPCGSNMDENLKIKKTEDGRYMFYH